MTFGKHKERVGTAWALTILALTGLSCFFAGLSLGLYLTRPGESLPTTLEGTVDTPTTGPTVEVTPGPTSTPSLVPALSPTPMPGRIQARVVKVIDGDTIEVETEGQVFKVRYNGIDTPEVGQPCADEATAKNIELVSGQRVTLVKDVSEVDKYGRLVRYVYAGDLFVNAEMVRQGYAVTFTYPPDVAHADEFMILEAEARQAGRGCWAPVARVAPEEVSVFVEPNCSQFDAPGNDNDNKSQEWVCFINGGTQSVEMEGWTVKDEYGWAYTFSPFTLEPGGEVRLHTGCGQNTATDIYWCKEG
ncbi:MAG: thermonuclease family protein, partial [Anaerolineae bacterium]